MGNYGCPTPGPIPCPSYLNSSLSGSRVTSHVAALCSYVYPSPPSPPSPNTPPGVETVEVFKTVIEFTSTEKYTDAELNTLKTNLASQYNVPVDKIGVEQTEKTTRRGRQLTSSYETKVTMESDSAAAMNDVTDAVESDMSSLESAQNIFGD